MSEPKVSINLCVLNGENYLREALDSVILQTYKDWDLVIINDGSSDGTEAIVHEYMKQGYPIIYHYQENKGLGYSRNEALKRSHGEYITFLDHDDIWLPHKLERQVSIFETKPAVGFLYSNYFIIESESDRKYLAYKRPQPSGHVFETFLYNYNIGLLTVAVRNEVFDRLDSLFDGRLSLSEEFDVFMRILYKTEAYYIDEPLAYYRVHSNMSIIKRMKDYPDEIDYASEKLKALDDNIVHKYAKGFQSLRSRSAYLRARAMMYHNDLMSARNYLRDYKFLSLKFVILYFLSQLPLSLWLVLRRIRQKIDSREGGL